MTLKTSKLYALYLHEFHWLATSIKNKCEKLFNEMPPAPESGYYIGAEPEKHAIIASLLADAANIKKLLYVSTTANRKHKKRAEELQKLFFGIALSEILNVKVRNSLEHFDEYLDDANFKLTIAGSSPNPLWAYNVVISDWHATNPRVYPIRLYVVSERCFYNFHTKIDIGTIYEEAKLILGHISSFSQIRSDKPGGLLLKVNG